MHKKNPRTLTGAGAAWRKAGRLRSFPTLLEILHQLDILVSVSYTHLLSERSLELDFRGSCNQRLIDLNRTRAAGEIVLYTPPEW